MPNQNGKVYGLTILSPIIDDDNVTPSHDLQIRKYLATLHTDGRSPFALAPGTHLARLLVLDDVIYVGSPTREEHLKSKYLVFESNCDGDLTEYLRGLATSAPEQLDAVWGHCVGYPGARDVDLFVSYMKACQIETTFFFAAVNDKSVPETLVALQTQRAVSDFIATHQGVKPEQLQSDFIHFFNALREKPIPKAGTMGPVRSIKTGGRNE
jgi:hypothetical protein